MTCQAIQDQILTSDDPRVLCTDVAAHVATCPTCAEFARRAGVIEAAGARLATPIDSNATLPARIMRSAHEILRPYFCLMGHSKRRALSRLAWAR